MDALIPIANAPVEPQEVEIQRRAHLAKDFESILMTRMLEEMKNTIGEWGDEEDAASQQMQGIFWMQMGQHVGESGGIGLWRQILQTMNQNDPMKAADSPGNESL